MEAGKHVVCEKPLGVGLADAVEAAEVAERTGVVNTMPFTYRFHPMARELRARVQADDFGAVNLIHGSYLQDWMLSPQATSWRVDPRARRTVAGLRRHRFALVRPGRMGDRRPDHRAGRHHRDLHSATTGRHAPPASAHARRPPPPQPDAPLIDVTTEDTALILFRTENGVVGSTVISQLSAGRKNRLWVEIDGMHHSGVFDQE